MSEPNRRVAFGAPRAVTDVRAVAVRPGRHVELPERVATEEPMEIRAAGPGQEASPVAVTMRTPGHDFELAVGFLVTEGLVRPQEVTAVGYCDEVEEPAERWNTVTVALRRPWSGPPQRAFTLTSSCGICGKTSLDQVSLSCPVVPPGPTQVTATVVADLPERLRSAQRVFDQTGGLHAAGAFDESGTLMVLREDVGRHNAVDKVAGHLALQGSAANLPTVLMVSGRVSFEIVQKAAMARFGIVAAVSAPSSLAVSAAQRLGVTLAGFVRNGTFNIYSGAERIALDR